MSLKRLWRHILSSLKPSKFKVYFQIWLFKVAYKFHEIFMYKFKKDLTPLWLERHVPTMASQFYHYSQSVIIWWLLKAILASKIKTYTICIQTTAFSFMFTPEKQIISVLKLLDCRFEQDLTTKIEETFPLFTLVFWS